MKTVIIVLVIFLSGLFAFATEEYGKQLFERDCNSCHGLKRSLIESKDLETWVRTIKRMAEYPRVSISEKDVQSIAEYLAGRGQKKRTSDDKTEGHKGTVERGSNHKAPGK